MAEKRYVSDEARLLAQWHPTKNGDLLPAKVTVGSMKKVWWICEEGHEWEATVNQRYYKNTGCPICSGRQALTGYNDLATTNPDLAAQWHPMKNGDLKPTEVTVRSAKKVWWLCNRCGHEWEAAISNRSNGNGCPRCAVAERVRSARFNKIDNHGSLAAKKPELATQWHPTKNGDLRPTDVTVGSAKKVWWLCNRCGHEWEASINQRSNGNGCPQCATDNHLKLAHGSLAEERPNIAAQWHPTKNGALTPSDVSSRSSQKVWWICEKGHEWKATVNQRSSSNSACPICVGKRVLAGYNDLATKKPELATQWHPTKNGDLRPTDVTVGSAKKVWWLCSVCGHEWEEAISYCNKRNGCPKCSRGQRKKESK